MKPVTAEIWPREGGPVESSGSSRLVRGFAVTLAVALFGACQEDEPERDLTPFIQLAQQSQCADLRNRIVEINNSMTMSSSVLLDQSGNCADASYRQALYGDTTADLLCGVQDSIAGPQYECPASSYAGMFQTILDHLDEEKLGLGHGFTVREVAVP